MAEEAPKQRLHVRHGSAEFDAEGPSDLVDSQFQRFLDALQTLPASKAPDSGEAKTGKPTSKEEEGGGGANGGDLSGAKSAAQAGRFSLPDEILARVFLVDKRAVSLKILPPGKDRDREALVVLMYGYLRLREIDLVMATELTKAARLSGLQLSRIDRVLVSQVSLLTTGGFGKGKKYGLNNQGVKRAEEVVRQMLG